MAFMVSLIRKRLSDTERMIDKKGIKALLHFFAFFFLFTPFVLWPVMAIQTLVVIPALAALFVAFAVFRSINAQYKLLAVLFAIASSGLWLCYGVYEYQMSLWAQTVIAPIRIDILFVAPFLYYSGMAYYHLLKITACFSGKASEKEF